MWCRLGAKYRWGDKSVWKKLKAKTDVLKEAGAPVPNAGDTTAERRQQDDAAAAAAATGPPVNPQTPPLQPSTN